MQNGVLPLNEKTLKLMRQKHPEVFRATESILLTDDFEKVHPIKFECITEESVRKTALKTKGGSGPSAMDAEGWRRILTSKQFGNSSSDLCKTIVRMTRKLCTVEDQHQSLEAFVACRLIPLDKNPGLRPIGVGEILRRIAGKVVVSTIREDITESVGSLQVCAGQEAGSEAAVHAMHEIFKEQDTEAVLLIDATNAFNTVNRNVLLHNVKVICPAISTYVNNCYCVPSRLFVIGGAEITSEEGTTQGDPTAMAMYAIATIPLIMMLLELTEKFPNKQTKMVAYADDLSAGGSLSNIKKWWKALCNLGPKFGYNPEASKCWLIVKPQLVKEAEKLFENTKINTTVNGKRHLGAVIGSQEYRDEYVINKTDQIANKLNNLCETAKLEPQAAYSCISSFKHKLK